MPSSGQQFNSTDFLPFFYIDHSWGSSGSQLRLWWFPSFLLSQEEEEEKEEVAAGGGGGRSSLFSTLTFPLQSTLYTNLQWGVLPTSYHWGKVNKQSVETELCDRSDNGWAQVFLDQEGEGGGLCATLFLTPRQLPLEGHKVHGVILFFTVGPMWRHKCCVEAGAVPPGYLEKYH